MEKQKKTIIHIITEDYAKKEEFIAELSIVQSFAEENEIYNIFFYESEENPPILLNSQFVTFHNYKSIDDLQERVLKISKADEIFFINTRLEKFIQLTNSLRKLVGQKITDFPEMYNDKSIQRELLYKNDLYVSVNYVKFKFKDLNFKKIEEKIGIPFILKPLNGVSSSGVVKIKTEKQFDKYVQNYKQFHQKLLDKGFDDNDEIMAEEYINGDLYSIDYFVNEEGIISFAPPLKVTLGTDIGVNDLFVISGIASEEAEKEYDIMQVKTFVERNVKATGVRNTFIHHEFKINKKGIYKTIELNGRIGGRRLPLYSLAYDVNLFSLLLDKEVSFELKTNVNFMKVWACRRGYLKQFNEKVIQKIEKLDSYYKIKIDTSMYGKEVGLTKDGFSYLGSIELMNKNNNKLNKDVEFIEENYCELLDIEDNVEIK